MLVAIRLKNCQSWEDNTIEFSTDKPNILIADNNTGKSVIMKMLKITANPKVYSANERKELIRHGEDSAILMCAFDDGSVSMTVVYPDRVLYRFKQNEELGFATYSEPPQIMLDHLGLITNSNIDFIANIIDMDQDLYLVNTKSSGNVAMLKLLAEEPILGEVLQKIEELSPRIKDEARLLTLHCSDLESTLSRYQYVDVDVLEQTINKSERILTLYDKIINLVEQCSTIKDITFDNTNYDSLLCRLECVLGCRSLLHLNSSLMFDSTDYSSFIDLIKILENLKYLSTQSMYLQYDKHNYTELNTALTMQSVMQKYHTFICEYATYLQKIDEEEIAIQEIRKEISQSGKVINCPIKGNVLYIDEKCVPYN